MLTDRMKNAITARLNRLVVMSTASVGYYWDSTNNKFVSTKTYNSWTWCGTYYAGQLFQLALALYLYYYNHLANDIAEKLSAEAENNPNKTSDGVLILVGIAIWLLITTMLALGSVAVEYRDEMVATMNQVWSLDLELKRWFPDVRRNNRQMEILVIGVCRIPLIIPFIFAGALFHPSNPLRGLFEAILEVPLTMDTPIAWVFLVLQTWGAFCFTGPIICLILMVLVVYQQSKEWLQIAAIRGSVIWVQRDIFFETENLGRQSEETLIWIYRSLQFVVGLSNLSIATVRFAYHFVAAMMIFVVSSFVIIRKGVPLLQDGSLTGYALLLIMVVTTTTIVFVLYVECLLIDGMENAWIDYKGKLLGASNSRTAIYKSAKSFLPVTVKPTHPFCNVNRSTFLEWFDAALNNLVNVLVA